MKSFSLFFLFSLLLGTLFAQAPQKMSYQAVIRSGGSLVINSAVGVNIRIRQTTNIGSIVFEEEHPGISTFTNANGLLSLEIGTGTLVSTDPFSDIDWAAGPYFLETNVDPTGNTNYTISSNSQLLSVPYALHAANVVWQQHGNDIYYNNGNVGIGTATPASDLHIEKLNPTIRFTDTDALAGDEYALINNTLGNNLLNFGVYNLSDARSELSFAGDGTVALPEGRLGIGTSTFSYPTTKLEIKGTLNDADPNVVNSLISISDNHYARYEATTYSNFDYRTAMLVGNRARGTMDTPLDVQAGDRVFGMYGKVYSGGMLHSSPISSIEYFTADALPSGIITFSTLSPLQLNRAERMRIDEEGMIGIGTDDPDTKVHVKDGDMYLEDTVVTPGNIPTGIILTDPNGNCWKGTITTGGTLTWVSITCP